MTLAQFLSLCVLLNVRYSSKYSAQIYRAQYGAAMLVYLRGTPTWWPENSENIWNLLCYLGDVLSALNKKACT